MKYYQLFKNNEGMLDWDIYIALKNGDTISCKSTEEIKWMLNVHDDFIILEKLQLNDKGYLDRVRTYDIPISSIVYGWSE